MGFRREIVYSISEPRRDVLWAGRDSKGNFFLKIWVAGWRTISGGQSLSRIIQGDGISVKGDESSGYTISLDGSLYDELKRITEGSLTKSDLEEITAEDVLNYWNTI